MGVKRCVACGGRIRVAEFAACASCGREVSPADAFLKPPGLLSLPQMRYQNSYVWLVLVSAMDIMLTMLVLVGHDGYEVNPVAAGVIETLGFGWAIVFKFATVVLVVVICEVVGRVRDRSGQKLARWAVAINSLPVAYTFALLFFAAR